MKDFKQIYEHELAFEDYSDFEKMILSSKFVRMFVYEICKKMIEIKPIILSTPCEGSTASWEE